MDTYQISTNNILIRALELWLCSPEVERWELSTNDYDLIDEKLERRMDRGCRIIELFYGYLSNIDE